MGGSHPRCLNGNVVVVQSLDRNTTKMTCMMVVQSMPETSTAATASSTALVPIGHALRSHRGRLAGELPWGCLWKPVGANRPSGSAKTCFYAAGSDVSGEARTDYPPPDGTAVGDVEQRRGKGAAVSGDSR